MVFNYTGGTGSTTDWIGVYLPGEIPDGDPVSLTWDYITTPSGQLILNGQNQSAPLGAGDYTVHLFCCDGYQTLASANFSIVGEAPAVISTASYPFAGDSVTFNYTGGTGSPTDWIGIYLPGEVPASSTSQVFVYVPTAEGVASLNISDLPAGDYDAHLFCCDGYSALASTSFTVYDKKTPSIVAVSAPQQGQPLSFNFAGGTGSFTDWIGIYPHGEVPDGTPPATYFLYVNAPNGSMTFESIDNLVPGTYYDAHLFCCDGYEILASFENFTVSTSAAADITKSKPVFYCANPASKDNDISLVFLEKASGNLIVYNALGQVTQQMLVNGQENVTLKALKAGYYSIHLAGQKGIQVLKIVVQ